MNEIWLAGEALGLGLIQDFALACTQKRIFLAIMWIYAYNELHFNHLIVTKASVGVIDYSDNRI